MSDNIGPIWKRRVGKQKYALVTAEGKLIDKFISKTVANKTKRFYEKAYFMSDLKIILIDELKNETRIIL